MSQATPRLFHGVKQLLPYVVKSSRGAIVTTECNRKFLDFTSGIGVTNLGHSHPGVTKAVIEAAPTLVHAIQNVMVHRPMMNLIGRLADLDVSKRAGFDSWFFWNSGSEAVEASVKLARQATKKPNIIVSSLGYHGRTFGTMALTCSSTIYRAGFGPLMGGVNVMPFPYLSQGPYRPTLDSPWATQSLSDDGFQYWGNAPVHVAAAETQRCLQQLELLLATQTSPSETAAILIEPVQGEGGYLPAPPEYMTGLRKICDKHGLLLICDEVQTGFGRTGSMFASDWLDGGVTPDILICAKGIANGYPLSAVATRSELSVLQPPGSMGGTYGGNAIGCAAALAVLDAFEKEKVLDNVVQQEALVRQLLQALQKTPAGALIREVRGRGLMIGVEFERLDSSIAAGATARMVVQECTDRDLLVLQCGPYDTLRLIPPLTVTTEEVRRAMGVLGEAISATYQKLSAAK